MQIENVVVPSPVGDLRLVVRRGQLCGLSFEDRWDGLREFLIRRESPPNRHDDGTAAEIVERIRRYFEGEVELLDEIPVDPGGTAFQQEVWLALRGVPVGRTMSYQDLAHRIGRRNGARAVATANAANPVAVVIPCHRVIHADGSISGYGGGVPRKSWLLRHEASHRPFELRG